MTEKKRTPERRRARVLAMQMLCQLEVQGDDAMADLGAFLVASNAPGRIQAYARSLVEDVWGHREDWDDRIGRASTQWRTERISPVERNILRVAVAEMLGGDVPMKVAINEAIEVGRQYGGVDTPRFVNGVLDAVYRDIREERGDGPS